MNPILLTRKKNAVCSKGHPTSTLNTEDITLLLCICVRQVTGANIIQEKYNIECLFHLVLDGTKQIN